MYTRIARVILVSAKIIFILEIGHYGRLSQISIYWLGYIVVESIPIHLLRGYFVKFIMGHKDLEPVIKLTCSVIIKLVIYAQP